MIEQKIYWREKSEKTGKLLSVLLLLGQVISYNPVILADEEQSTTDSTAIIVFVEIHM